MARGNGNGRRTHERNVAARGLLPKEAAALVACALSEGTLNELEGLLVALEEEACRVNQEEAAKEARRVLFEFEALLYGGPPDADDLAMPCEEAIEVPPAVHTWSGLCGLRTLAESVSAVELRIASKRCPVSVLKRMGLTSASEDDEALVTMANATTAVQDQDGIVCFAPAICDRLDKTGVAVHADGMLSALAVVAERMEPRDIEPHVLRGSLLIPRFNKVSDEEVRYLPGLNAPPSLVGAEPPRGQLPLFEMPPPAGPCPSWLLALYDQAGGTSKPPGHGAPWALRLFVGALLSVPVDERDGLDRRFRVPVGELARWLHPDGWDRSNRRRDWEAFQAALRSLDQLRIRYRLAACSNPDECYFCREAGGHLVSLRVVDVPGVPLSWNRGRTPVEIRVAIPESAAMGARVDWRRLTQYGVQSAVLYRAYLSVCAVLDHSARGGKPLTKMIAAPKVNAEGKPIRRRGRILRDSSLAVPNPASRYVGYLRDDDLRRMVGLRADHPENRKRARGAIERLADDGVIDVDQHNDGRLRFFGPSPTAQPSDSGPSSPSTG